MEICQQAGYRSVQDRGYFVSGCAGEEGQLNCIIRMHPVEDEKETIYVPVSNSDSALRPCLTEENAVEIDRKDPRNFDAMDGEREDAGAEV